MSVSKMNLVLIKIFDGEKVLNENYELIKDNVVHKEAFVDWNNISIGAGNIIGPFSLIGSQAQHKFYETAGKFILVIIMFFMHFVIFLAHQHLKEKP